MANKSFKKTVVKASGDNGVFHDVYAYADGTITAHKIIDGKIVQTYDWTGESRESLINTFKSSGHEEYTLYEEIEDKHERHIELKDIIVEVQRQSRMMDVHGSVTVWEYDSEYAESPEYEVCVSLFDDFDESYVMDKCTDTYTSRSKAFARAKHIAKKLREGTDVEIEHTGDVIHGIS